MSALEEEANLPVEEVIRRMKERAAAEGDGVPGGRAGSPPPTRSLPT